MSDPYNEGSNSVVIGIIRDFRKELALYEESNSADRAAFKASIEDSIVQLRKDFSRALHPIMLETLDSRKSREDILKSLNEDYAARTQRQAQVDKQLTIFIIVLVALGVLVVMMFLVLIIRIVVISRV